MKLFLPVLLVIGAVFVLAIKFLPWWGSLAGFVGFVLAAKFLGGRMIKRFFLSLFNAKSTALRGAHAELHQMTRADAPKRDLDFDEGDDDEEDEVGGGPIQRYIHLDVTIRIPEDASGKTPFQAWDPFELSIVSMSARPGMEFDEDEDVGELHGVDVWQDGKWVEVEDKLVGTQRVRLHAGIYEGTEKFKLRYYFEILENRPAR